MASKNRRGQLRVQKLRKLFLERLEDRQMLAADLAHWQEGDGGCPGCSGAGCPACTGCNCGGAGCPSCGGAGEAWRPELNGDLVDDCPAGDHEHDHAHGDGHLWHQHDDVGVEGVDRLGNHIFIDGPEPPELAGGAGDDDGPQGIAPLADTFKLHSRPGATKTIMLDFDGHTTTGTTWNAASGRASIVSPAYDPDRNGASFTNNELGRIQRIWQRVAEDFAMFDVNVTTEDPGAAALSKSGGGDTEWGTRVVITPDDWDNCGCGGFAYLRSFNDPTDEPVFVFNSSEIGVSAAASHEVGHAVGLSHDGIVNGPSYYNGHGPGDVGWGPIMGSGYYQDVTTWDRGEYFRANNQQDDWNIITTQNGFGFRPDDHSNNVGGSTPVTLLGANGADPLLADVEGFGVIETGSDLDWFTFTASSGTIDLTINAYVAETFVNNGAGFTRTVETTPNQQGSNVNIEARLYDSSMTLLQTSDPELGLSASFSDVAIAGGTYFIRIDGVGYGNWAANPPTGFGQSVSRGQYLISGTVPNARLIANADAATTIEGNSVDIDVLANDSDPQNGTFGITDLGTPANGNVTETNGIVTYTPNPAFTGIDTFTYEITDDQGDVATGTVTVTVTPSILFIDDDQGESFERFYTGALDDNGRGYHTWDVEGQGIPSPADLGPYSVVIWNTGYDFNAPDAGLSLAEQNTIQDFLDNGGGIFIVGQDILYNGVEANFLTDYLKVDSYTSDIRALASFAGVPGNAIGDGLTLPFALPADYPADWSDILAPTPDAQGVFYRNVANGNTQPFNTIAYDGNFRMVFMAAPFEGISTADEDPNNQKVVMGRIVDFLLGNNNRAPNATDNNYATPVNTSFTTGNLLTDPIADSDPDGDPLTVDTTPVAPPANGNVVLSADGTFNYTPNLDFTGVDTFIYRITDGNGAFDSATVTMTVGTPNRRPEANDDSFTTLEDTNATGNVLDNDSDPDGDPLNVNPNPVTDVSNGTLTLNANGTFTYIPNDDFHGTDSFVYEVDDGRGLSDTATVTLTVTPVNDAPAIDTPGTITLPQDSPPQTVDLTGIDAGGGESQTLSVTATSDNPALIPNPTVVYTSPNSTGTLNFTPTPGLNGVANITVTVDDDGGVANGGDDSTSVTFTVIVNPPSNDWLFFSRKNTGNLGGVTYDQQDIIGFDGTSFSKFFDATNAAPNMVIDAFSIASNGDLYFSFTNSGNVGGVNVDDSDIVRFNSSSQTWSQFFDGSDVGLTRNGEDIDGFSITESGQLLISTNGSARVSGLQAADEDIMLFTPNSLGPNTSGSWSMYFDGSDVGLSDTSSEDVDGFSVAPDSIHFSTIGSFNTPALAGTDEDVGRFNPTQTGSFTTGTFQSPLVFDGSAFGFTNDIGSLHVITEATPPSAAPAEAAGLAFGLGEPLISTPPAVADGVDNIAAPSVTAPAANDPFASDEGAAGVVRSFTVSPRRTGRFAGLTLLVRSDAPDELRGAETSPAFQAFFDGWSRFNAAADDDRLLDMLAENHSESSKLDRFFARWR